jgi:hypothetical protein
MARHGAFSEQRVPKGEAAKSSASQQPKTETVSRRQALEAYRARTGLSELESEAGFEAAMAAGILDFRKNLDGSWRVILKSPKAAN